MYCKQLLNIKIQLVLINKDKNWKEDVEVGPLCADDVYVSLNNIDRYQDKFKDLINFISVHKSSKKVSIFFFYTEYKYSVLR